MTTKKAAIERAVNAHARLTAINADLLAALKAVDDISQHSAGAYFEIPADEWRDVMALVHAAIVKAETK